MIRILIILLIWNLFHNLVNSGNECKLERGKQTPEGPRWCMF